MTEAAESHQQHVCPVLANRQPAPVVVSLWTPQPAFKVDCFYKAGTRLLDKLTQLQPRNQT